MWVVKSKICWDIPLPFINLSLVLSCFWYPYFSLLYITFLIFFTLNLLPKTLCLCCVNAILMLNKFYSSDLFSLFFSLFHPSFPHSNSWQTACVRFYGFTRVHISKEKTNCHSISHTPAHALWWVTKLSVTQLTKMNCFVLDLNWEWNWKGQQNTYVTIVKAKCEMPHYTAILKHMWPKKVHTGKWIRGKCD